MVCLQFPCDGPRGAAKGSLPPGACGRDFPVIGAPPEGEPVAARSTSVLVEIQLLGRFAVRVNGRELPLRLFGGRLARQLLRKLALARGTLLSKDVAAEALWPVDPPADAPGNVEILISRIRRGLGDRSLVKTGPGGYTLVGDGRCWVDVEAFLAGVARGQAEAGNDPVTALAAFRGALALWRGEPLAEDAYAEWAQEHRRYLWRAHLEALEGAATAALATGDPAAAVAWAQAAAEQQPLRETSVLLLVRALVANGDRAAALGVFDGFGRDLGEELGVDPSAEALRLRQRVLRDEIRTQSVTSGPPRDADGHATLAPSHKGRARALAAGAVQARLAALPAEGREVLALLALVGRHAPASVLATAAGRDLRVTLDALDWLSRVGLAEAGCEGWAMVAGVAGQTVVEDLAASERARLHLLLAHALRQHGADSAEVAHHLAGGGDRPAAASEFAAAAVARLDRIADEEATRLAEAGLALSPQTSTRARLLEVRGEARRRRGRLSQARGDLEGALAEITLGADRSRTLARLAILEARSRSAIQGGELIELAIAEAGEDPAARGQALAAGAIVDLALAQLDRSERHCHQAHRLLDQAGDTTGTVRLLYWRGMSHFVAGRLVEAVNEFEHLAHLSVTPVEVLRLWNPQAARGHALALMAEPATGLTEIEDALSWARAVGHPAMRSSCLWHRSEALTALGNHVKAVGSAQEALDIARRIEHAEMTAASLRGLGIAWQAAGDLERAEEALRGSLCAAQALPLFAAWASARLGLVLVGQERLAEAEPFIGTALTGGVPLTRHEARWAQAELLCARGDSTGPELAAVALRSAREARYLALVPRLAELSCP